MEHRRYLRHDTSLAIKLVINGELLAVTRSIEMSRGGASIVNPGLSIRQNQILELQIPELKGRGEVRIKSMVVHSSPASVGLMFGRYLPVENLIFLHGELCDEEEKVISWHIYRDESRRKNIRSR